MNKQRILDSIIETLRNDEMLLIRANLEAKEAATEPEAKPENEYDTRALEQSYLAAGQARRAEELKEGILTLKALPLASFPEGSSIELTALVGLENEEGETRFYFLVPSQGGIKVKHDGLEISTLSPESPLGRALIGKHLGDSVDVTMSGKPRSLQIVRLE